MSANVWTHPDHCKVAVVGTAMNVASLTMCVLSFMVVTWFSSDRYSLALKYTLIDMDVDCAGDMCVRASVGSIADWQKTAFNLIFAGMINNCVTTALLVCAFWPLVVLKNKVINPLLVTCRVLDFVGAYFKVIGACIYLNHAHDISKHYVMRRPQFILRLESLPLAFLLISFLMEMVSFVFLLVATDRVPRTGGLSHRERLGLDVCPKELDAAILPERKVSYMPDVKESHMRVLSQLKITFVAHG